MEPNMLDVLIGIQEALQTIERTLSRIEEILDHQFNTSTRSPHVQILPGMPMNPTPQPIVPSVPPTTPFPSIVTCETTIET